MTEREKLLDKLAKIKAHADSAAAIGSEAEAEAFATMLQRLLLKHKLDMTDVEFAKMEEDEPVEEYYINYAKYGLGTKQARVQWTEALSAVVAKAHFCRILVHPRSSRITLVGRKSDCAVAEYLIVTLIRAVEKIALHEYRRYYHECAEAGERWRCKGFRQAFLKAFVIRIAQRFEEERRAQEGASEFAIVRVNRAEAAVKNFMSQACFRPAGQLSRKVLSNDEGTRRGINAADRVNLKANAMNSVGKSPRQIGG